MVGLAKQSVGERREGAEPDGQEKPERDSRPDPKSGGEEPRESDDDGEGCDLDEGGNIGPAEQKCRLGSRHGDAFGRPGAAKGLHPDRIEGLRSEPDRADGEGG